MFLMSQNIIPENVSLAAKRGFVRTATQSLASVIPITAIARTADATPSSPRQRLRPERHGHRQALFLTPRNAKTPSLGQVNG